MGAVRKQRQFGYYASSFLPQKPEEQARVLIREEAVINKMKVCTLKSLLGVKLFYCIL